MARFYARFDGGTESNLEPNADYFNKLRVSGNSASGALYRNGLIASRSALSADVYADLDAVNKNGNIGTYFPQETSPGPFSSDYATFASWSSAYTSSIEGIKIPTTNTYGIGDVNYSKRPTASVAYNNSGVAQTTPIDPVGVSYITYYSASSAVRAVLDVIQTTSSVSQTPYTRPGTVPSRTIHSVFNDPGLNYFAWDDFTPGQPTATMDIDGLNKGTTPPEIYPGGTPVNTDLVIKLSISGWEYINDYNPNGTIGLNMTVDTSQSNDGLASLQLNGGAHGGPLTIGSDSSGNGPTNPRQGGSSTWDWDKDSYILTWNLGLTAGEYTLRCDARVYDVIITSNVGNTRFVTVFPTTSTGRFIVKDGDPA
jgi:hypothetical protein